MVESTGYGDSPYYCYRITELGIDTLLNDEGRLYSDQTQATEEIDEPREENMTF